MGSPQRLSYVKLIRLVLLFFFSFLADCTDKTHTSIVIFAICCLRLICQCFSNDSTDIFRPIWTSHAHNAYATYGIHRAQCKSAEWQSQFVCILSAPKTRLGYYGDEREKNMHLCSVKTAHSACTHWHKMMVITKIRMKKNQRKSTNFNNDDVLNDCLSMQTRHWAWQIV